MGKYDGKVTISTALDNNGVKKGVGHISGCFGGLKTELKQIDTMIKSTFSGADMSGAEKEIAQLEFETQNLGAALDEAKKKLDEFQNRRSAAQSVLDNASVEYTPPDKFIDADQQVRELSAAITEQQDITGNLQKRWDTAMKSLEQSRERLAVTVEKAAQKQAKAEEKASLQAAKAAQKAAQEHKKVMQKAFGDATKPVKRFGLRLREIVSGALVFNLISSALRNVTQYFGTALKTNTEFTESFAQLKGALLTAFQPIYSAVAPALTYMVKLATMAANAISVLFATLTDSSVKDNAAAAKSMYEKADAISATGSAAADASKSMAAFDEINTLQNGNSSGGGGGGGGDTLPDFSLEELPQELEGRIKSFALTIEDIFFDWSNLTAENIVSKAIAALAGIAGAVAGFTIGGVPGALVGTLLGLTLGVVISDTVFDGDGTLSDQEIIESLVLALGAIGGAVIGFAVGGPGGAAIGMLVGLGITFSIVGTNFLEKENPLTGQTYSEDILDTWEITSKTPSDSNIQWLSLDDLKNIKASFADLWDYITGGSKKTSAEVSKNASEAASESTGFFEKSADAIAYSFEQTARQNDANFIIPTREDFKNTASWIKEKFNDANKSVTQSWKTFHSWWSTNVSTPVKTKTSEVKSSVHQAFGTAKTDIQNTWKAFSSWWSTNVATPIKNKSAELKTSISTAFSSAKTSAQNAWKTVASWWGTNISTPIKSKTSEIKNSVTTAFGNAKTTIQNTWKTVSGWWATNVSTPLKNKAAEIKTNITTAFTNAKTSIQTAWKSVSEWWATNVSAPIKSMASEIKTNVANAFNDAKAAVQNTWKSVSSWWSTNVSTPIKNKVSQIKTDVSNAFTSAQTNVKNGWKGVSGWWTTNVSDPIKKAANSAGDSISQKFASTRDAIKKAWGSVSSWFRENVSGPINKLFAGIGSAISGIFSGKVTFEGLTNSLSKVFKSFINNLIRGLNSILSSLISPINNLIGKLRTAEIFGFRPFRGIEYISTPRVPYLAQGAVLPANKPFLAMVGDQKHGTNIEAPLATIQEAVALVMEDMVQSNIAGHEATVAVLQQILEAVLGIELDGASISRAVDQYNRKMAVVRGGG